jgi:hypothetical protein
LRRRFPALLLERLNFDEDSPMRSRIRTPTTAGGTIKDNSILKMLSASIEDGALYQYFDSETGDGDADAMLELLKNFWTAVAECFPDEWKESPRRSRLVHGVGIASLGCLMDEIAYVKGPEEVPTSDEFGEELQRIEPQCHWMKGSWKFANGDSCAWNELQNTPKDILRLSDHLLRLYRDTQSSTEEQRQAA